MSQNSPKQSSPLSQTQTEEKQYDPQQETPQKKQRTKQQAKQDTKSKQKQKSKSKKINQSLSKKQKKEEAKQAAEQKQKPKKKGGKKPQKKQEKKQEKVEKVDKVQKKQEKADKSKKQPKRKPKSKKQPQSKDSEQSKSKVLDYMQKQNRPYNLLNIFDNLHGKIKKADLEIILNELSQEGEFICKQFGKNKVYFINQDKYNVNMKEVEEVGSNYTRLKQEMQILKDQNKRLNDEYRRLIVKKTLEDLELESFDLSAQINKLKKKREYLVSGDMQKVDQGEVKVIEKETEMLDKELRKRKKLLKDCLDSWCEMTEKKVMEVADIMGIELV